MHGTKIYSELGYLESLTDSPDVASLYPDYADLTKVGADRVYFSEGHPAVLFLEISSFSDTQDLRRIVDVRHKAWNYQKVILLFALSETEIRIYNCYEKPLYVREDNNVDRALAKAELIHYDFNRTDADTLSVLEEVFSRVGVDTGLLWTDRSGMQKKVDLNKRLDNYLIQSLVNTATELENMRLDTKIVHNLLMRSLFILFLEDKGAAKEAGLYAEIQDGCSSYFDILDSKDATYRLFDLVGEHFNGNVTPVLPDERETVTEDHLQIIKRCFIDGNISEDETLIQDWRLFNFEIIRTELLSEIYENFLERDRQHEKGQFYTPHNLVEFILSKKLPADSERYNTRILDPACGSGIFLVEGYKCLIKRWKKANHTDSIDFGTLKDLLLNNIYGIEIEETAMKVTAFSLYLALIDELDPKTLWLGTDYRLPYLIYDPDDDNIKTQGHNLWRRDTIGQVDPNEFTKVDLVIGNPPYGASGLSTQIVEYCNRFGFPHEQVIPFIHKSVEFCPDGEIVLIFSSKILTNTKRGYPQFRKWLFNDNYVEKVYNLSIFRKVPKSFGGQLFASASVPVSIVDFRHAAPDDVSETIEYWAPKTYVKSNVIDGIVIDSSDVKDLPRIECAKPDSKIWKIAYWGDYNNFRLLKRLKTTTLKDYFKTSDEGWIYGKGMNSDKKNPDLVPEKIIKTECIDRYFTDPESSTQQNTTFYRKNKEGLFSPPFVVCKEGLHKKEIACSLFNGNAYCTTGTSVMTSENFDKKKIIVSYLNSDIVKYILFLTSSSWGIERERILLDELLELPSPFLGDCRDSQDVIVNAFDRIVSLKKNGILVDEEIRQQETVIFKEFAKIFSLTERELILIEDTLTFNLDLFMRGRKSIGFGRTLMSDSKSYAAVLCKSVNGFLGTTRTVASATIYEVQIQDPLNMVVIRFGDVDADVETRDIDALRKQLQTIDKYMIHKKNSSIYVQKNIKHYENDSVYIIKPNQRRFWTRSQALEDAASITADILNMGRK